MITKLAIEDYAKLRGGYCLDIFSAREEILADKMQRKLAKGYLNRRLEFLSEKKEGLPKKPISKNSLCH